jgi:hypothetical protein
MELESEANPIIDPEDTVTGGDHPTNPPDRKPLNPTPINRSGEQQKGSFGERQEEVAPKPARSTQGSLIDTFLGMRLEPSLVASDACGPSEQTSEQAGLLSSSSSCSEQATPEDEGCQAEEPETNWEGIRGFTRNTRDESGAEPLRNSATENRVEQSEGESMEQEGESMEQDGESVEQDGKSVGQDSELVVQDIAATVDPEELGSVRKSGSEVGSEVGDVAEGEEEYDQHPSHEESSNSNASEAEDASALNIELEAADTSALNIDSEVEDTSALNIESEAEDMSALNIESVSKAKEMAEWEVAAAAKIAETEEASVPMAALEEVEDLPEESIGSEARSSEEVYSESFSEIESESDF